MSVLHHSSTALSATVGFVHIISEHNYLDFSAAAKMAAKTAAKTVCRIAYML